MRTLRRRNRRFLDQKWGIDMSDQAETEWHLQVQVFPNGTRDFQFVFPETEEATGSALPFLFTDCAPWLLERIEQETPQVAKQVFLAQLLSCCLEYRGNRRHLVVENWGQREIDGSSIRSGSDNFRRQLSLEQAEEFRLVTSGQLPPSGTLAEVFWDAHVTTPRLPNVFEDELMGEMAIALLNVLNPISESRNELRTSQIRSTIWRMWSEEFSDFDLNASKRERRPVFKRLMSATIRFASQFNGEVARVYVLDSIRRGEIGSTDISSAENKLIELRYGGRRSLEDINVALLFGSDGLYRGLINDYGQALAQGNETAIEECEQLLAGYFALLQSSRERQRIASNTERRERRQRHQDFLPAPRIQAQDQPDVSVEEPTNSSAEIPSELLAVLAPELKARDWNKFEALVEADWNWELAAERLQIPRTNLRKQWRETVRKNVLAALTELGITEDSLHQTDG